MTELITLQEGTLTAYINPANQQLCGLDRNGMEFIWGGGKPEGQKTPEEKAGWPNSEIAMFPVVGRLLDDKLRFRGEEYSLGQHGLSRHLDWEPMAATSDSVTYVQRYTADTPVKNRKFPQSGLEFFAFPRSYVLTKTYRVEASDRRPRFRAEFTVENPSTSTKTLYAEIGWHPAFKAPGDKALGTATAHNVGIIPEESIPYSLSLIERHSMDPEKGALKLPGTRTVDYVGRAQRGPDKGSRRVHVTHNFGNTMLWSPAGQKQMCIEPVSALPNKSYRGDLTDRSGVLKLSPGEARTFWTHIDVGTFRPRTW